MDSLEKAAEWYCNHEITCFDYDNFNNQLCITYNFYSAIRNLLLFVDNFTFYQSCY